MAHLKHKCQLLTRLNELRQEECELLKEKFNLALTLKVETAVQSRLKQIKEEQQTVVNTEGDIVKDDVEFAEARVSLDKAFKHV